MMGYAIVLELGFSKFYGIKNTWSMVDQTILVYTCLDNEIMTLLRQNVGCLTNMFNGFIISFWIVHVVRFINQPLIEMR